MTFTNQNGSRLMFIRCAIFSLTATISIACLLHAQNPDGTTLPSDLQLVEKLLAARRDYEKALGQLRAHYLKVGEVERARLAEGELIQYQRIPKNAFRLDLDVPPPNLHGSVNIVNANHLYTAALSYKDKGWGTLYMDNQRRAELLFRQLLTQYPESTCISEAAYQLGDIYSSSAYRQYGRAALYFERCVEWDSTTSLNARLRAARLYDHQLQQRSEARRLYQEILNCETDLAQLNEASKRLVELSRR